MSNGQSLTRKHAVSSYCVQAMLLQGYVGGGGHDDSKQRGRQQRPQKSTRCQGGWCRSAGAPHPDLRAIKEGFLEMVKPGLRQMDSQFVCFLSRER